MNERLAETATAAAGEASRAADPPQAGPREGLDFERWRRLTRGAIERSEVEQAELRRQLDALDQQIARCRREAEALRGAVEVVQATLRRAEPRRSPHRGHPAPAGPVEPVDPADLASWRAVGKAERIRLWARAHGGLVAPAALFAALAAAGLYRSPAVARGALSGTLAALTYVGELQREADGRYRFLGSPGGLASNGAVLVDSANALKRAG